MDVPAELDQVGSNPVGTVQEIHGGGYPLLEGMVTGVKPPFPLAGKQAPR
jgi:hypothetical protein